MNFQLNACKKIGDFAENMLISLSTLYRTGRRFSPLALYYPDQKTRTKPLCLYLLKETVFSVLSTYPVAPVLP